MSEDFDYVSMDSYQADMRETARLAGAAIEKLRRRAEQAERLAMELVLAAGGKIVVDLHDLNNPLRKITWIQSRNIADTTIEFRALITPLLSAIPVAS
jgi:hypothetical protein